MIQPQLHQPLNFSMAARLSISLYRCRKVDFLEKKHGKWQHIRWDMSVYRYPSLHECLVRVFSMAHPLMASGHSTGIFTTATKTQKSAVYIWPPDVGWTQTLIKLGIAKYIYLCICA